MKISEDLRMEVLTPERAVDASILLATMFADYECITRCIGLTATYYRYWSDSICLRAARLGVSTIVLNQLDQVVAACVCIDGAEDDSEADDDPEEQFHAYDAIMHRLQTRLRIKRGYAPLHNSTDWILGENEWSNWPEMPPGKMMHILMLGCSPEYQGRGLVQIICKKSMELSIAAGYEEFFYGNHKHSLSENCSDVRVPVRIDHKLQVVSG
eukprot:TRINITY_DN8698_c0_g1_i2.p1 TRINITY_DN8698_c0_g1~~TRINITY_DN8698_c0_g1_i2.p1  ORF type:complete len:212 (+),score=34.47 TRINITY_DN8698_c0_g1_i2:78-713(+)